MFQRIYTAGWTDPDEPSRPNRAERRAQVRKERSAQKIGQRAYERTLAQGEQAAEKARADASAHVRYLDETRKERG
jgi:hypothetical protein